MRSQESSPSIGSVTSGFWRPIAEAPKDGSPIWAFLHETGIRLLRWVSEEECAKYEGSYDVTAYDGCWVQVSDFDEEWSPEFWAPLSTIPLPANASERFLAALAKATGQ